MKKKNKELKRKSRRIRDDLERTCINTVIIDK